MLIVSLHAVTYAFGWEAHHNLSERGKNSNMSRDVCLFKLHLLIFGSNMRYAYIPTAPKLHEFTIWK